MTYSKSQQMLQNQNNIMYYFGQQLNKYRNTNSCRLNNTVFNNEWITEKYKREITTILGLTGNNTTGNL